MIDQYLGILFGIFVLLPILVFVGLPIYAFLVVAAFKVHWTLGVLSIPLIPMIWVRIWDELDSAGQAMWRRNSIRSKARGSAPMGRCAGLLQKAARRAEKPGATKKSSL